MKITPPTEANRSELSVVPLVNVVFLLLVFFMLVGQIKSPEPLDVQPPQSLSDKDGAERPVRILLTRGGEIAVERTVVRESQLTERVAQRLARDPSARFQVKADARTEGVLLIRVMERLHAAGVTQLTLLTEQRAGR